MPYLANAVEFLVDIAFDALLVLFLLRLFAELWRVDFRNPVSQFIYRYSNPVLARLRRHIPNWRRWNVAALLIAWILALLKSLALVGVQYRTMPHVGGWLLMGVGALLGFGLLLYVVLIFVWALASLFTAGASAHAPPPAMQFVAQLVEPVTRPLSRRMPKPGGIDFSPAIAIVVLMLLRILVATPLFAQGLALAMATSSS